MQLRNVYFQPQQRCCRLSKTHIRDCNCRKATYIKTSPTCSSANGAAGQAMKLNYLPIRGRGEPIRLTLAALDLPWEEVHYGTWNEESKGLVNIDWGPEIKQDLDLFEYFQGPSVTIGDHNYSQSNAVVRHLAREHGLYGSTAHEALRIDAIVDGVDDLRRKFFPLAYLQLMQPDGKENYWKKYGNPESMTAWNQGGAHFGFLSALLQKCDSRDGYAVGSKLTVADLLLFDITDNHLPLYADELNAEYPELVEHHKFIKSLPAIQKYLQSDQRFPHVLGTNVIVDDVVQPDKLEQKKQAVQDFMKRMQSSGR